MNSVELIARTICAGCDDNPDHAGDARGNEYRWQDYRTVAVKVLDVFHGTPCEQIRHKEKLDRLLTLATKHCPRDHHDWSEIVKIAEGT